MPDYEDGKIYQIANIVDDRVYIGSTTGPLNRRLVEHRSSAKTFRRASYTQLDKIGWDNVYIELLEAYPCKSKEELCAREQYYIDLLIPEFNEYNAIGGPCEHGRDKWLCKDCDGVSICEHKARKYQCKKCNGDKYHCDVCDTNYCSKPVLKRHMTNNSHKKMELAMLMDKMRVMMEKISSAVEDLEF